jgi:plasmid stabilization system protein ParE
VEEKRRRQPMKGFEFSPEAVNDLQEIWIYIAADDVDRADQLEADIYQACEQLAKSPGLGHKRRDLTNAPVLFWPVRGQYLVIYLRDSQPLQIVRILHGARDIPSQF